MCCGTGSFSQSRLSMDEIKSQERREKIERTLAYRQPTLTIVLENIHDPHNVSAILRSCDAVGIQRVHLLYTIEEFPEIANTASSGAHKWLELVRHDSAVSCFSQLHAEGFRILGTRIDSNARSLYEYDYTQSTAFVLGNEHRGISDEAATLADDQIYIPMMGMAESLNVSVASAVCLFEALRQRKDRGMYDTPQLSPEILRSKKLEWLLK
jgi:tRNA (guanosine-2'-O-)-methyltransferase